ncbi:MAG: hypothetical protein KGL74_06335, partial [Elusimicrobia bacterium]|nr:hypothetical protein [Elusimicrobiota bacterium]
DSASMMNDPAVRKAYLGLH